MATEMQDQSLIDFIDPFALLVVCHEGLNEGGLKKRIFHTLMVHDWLDENSKPDTKRAMQEIERFFLPINKI